MHVPRSTRGASRGVLECGLGAVASEGCKTHTRAEAAEAERSRRASRAPPGALGGRSYRRCQPPRDAEAPAAVVRRPSRKQGSPKRRDHRGSRRIRLQTPRAGRRRNGGLADYQHERCLIERYRSASVSRETEARRSDHDPGVPRRPHFSAAFSTSIARTRNAPRECGSVLLVLRCRLFDI